MYVFNTTYLIEKLTPPVLRKVRVLAYLRVLLASLQIKWNDILEYFGGSNYSTWAASDPYLKGDRIKYGYAIYEALIANTNITPYGNESTWLIINKDFVGIDAKVRFNGQKMIFEYVLNLYLNTTATTIPLIYTTRNNVDTNGFYLGVDGDSSFGELGLDSNQNDYLGTSYIIGQYAMSIYVPLSIYNSLASSPADRESRVRNIADRYIVAGINYNVLTY